MKTQKAINFLIKNRDIHYMQAVHSTDTAKFIEAKNIITPGSPVFQSLRENTKSIIACNVVSYNQIEGHVRAAMDQNAILVLEVARSQLSYALDEVKTMEYLSEIIRKTNCNIPIVVHGDHIQYTANLFNQKKILADIYKEKTGQDWRDDLDLNKIDQDIIQETHKKFKKNADSERQAITEIIERIIKAGFTSVAIDASTIYDEIAGEAVFNYYSRYGTEIEKMIIELEKNFALSLEWGVEILKLDLEKNKAQYDKIKEDLIADMKKRGKSEEKITERLKELERSFGILANESKKRGLDFEETKNTYDKIMRQVAEATIRGKLNDKVKNSLSENEKLLLLPTSNAAETVWQLEQIDKILSKENPKLKNTFGIEVEVGHVDKRIPNPRLGGKMESKVTHPEAVKVMGKYLKQKNLRFDLIATNNGSGHGTEFDKKSLIPISQVDKISPYLTKELQIEAEKFAASLAQHGTSGSDLDELAELSRKGVIKFNIATNYQQIILNILSLTHDGFTEDKLIEKVLTSQTTLMNGLEEKTRANIKFWAKEFIEDEKRLNSKANDSLFLEFLKKTYTWGVKKGKITANSSHEDIATVLAKEFKRVFGEMDEKLFSLKENINFKIATPPQSEPEADISSLTSAITAAALTQKGMRGQALGLDKNNLEEKEKIDNIKDEADGEAKRIYEQIIKNNKTILIIRASEGFARDGVAESFRANDMIMPDELENEKEEIKKTIEESEKEYQAKNGDKYKIEYAVIDVVENTNSFVTNVDNTKLEDLSHDDPGASSIIAIGDGVKSIGNIPDYYADSIFTIVPVEKIEEFNKNPLDPEATASDPEKQEEYLERIASANNLTINDLEIVFMDRERENARLDIVKKLQKKYPGLKITLIKDGTVSHALHANLGRTFGKHKIMMTVGAAPEGFFNLSVASALKENGAIGSLRIYTKNVSKTKEGAKAENLARRYDFDTEEIKRIQELRPDDSEEIINGKKLFTQEDIHGDVSATYAFITNSGVFGIKGVEKLPQNFYETTILRIQKVNNKPCAWFEKRVIGS